ncbi:DUF4407 domain-containing protein [Actinomadura nitritigenes]|uniref:DUF4407 domain-containing protein n=1 Tax=Actinomadura nitritigenes TaxID=134602 RepID=UPI003D8B9562
MRRFLIYLSAARPDILALSPSDRARFEGLGAAVLTTGALASLSMWFALLSGLHVNPFAAAPVAVGWGLVVMNLDRWLISSSPIGRGRLATLPPRLAMAFLISVVISTPLILQIFSSEIKTQITLIKQERADTFVVQSQNGELGKQIAELQLRRDRLREVIQVGGDVPVDIQQDKQIKDLTAQRNSAVAQRDKYYNQWQCELIGEPACAGSETRSGSGPLAKAAEQAYRSAASIVSQLDKQISDRTENLTAASAAAKSQRVRDAQQDLPQVEQQLHQLLEEQLSLSANFDADNRAGNGLLLRITALNHAASRDTTVAMAWIFIFLLILLIECLPVTVKLIQRPGTYERMLDLVARTEFRHARERYADLRPRREDHTTATRSISDIWNRSTPEGAALTEDVQSATTGPLTVIIDDDTGLRSMSDTELRSMDDARRAPSDASDLFPDDL